MVTKILKKAKNIKVSDITDSVKKGGKFIGEIIEKTPSKIDIKKGITGSIDTAREAISNPNKTFKDIKEGLDNLIEKTPTKTEIIEGIETGIDKIRDSIPSFWGSPKEEKTEIINLDSKDLSIEDYKKALENLETDNSFDYSSLATAGIGTVAGTGVIAATGFKVTLFGLSVFALPAWPILAAGGLAGAAVGYGIYKWNHKNGMEAYIKEALKQDLRAKIEKQRKEMTKLDREKQKILVADNILIAAFKRKAKEEDFKDLQDLMSLLISDGAEPEAINETLKSLF